MWSIMLDLSKIILKRFLQLLSKEILYMGHKNRYHLHMVLLYHIWYYTKLQVSEH